VSFPEDALRRALARARDRELGEILLRKGVVAPDALERALESDDPRPLTERLGLPADAARSAEPEAVTRAREQPDRVVSGYVLVERLGEGALAEVWKAWDPAATRWIALKLLQGVPHRPETIERWRREVLAAGRLTHPNLVPVYSAGEHQGRPWIAMAYIPGASLEERPPDRADAVRLLRIVAHAVHHAHEHGVVHRDLKPSNLLVDREGNPWVCDFGIARILDEPKLTAPGTLLGTAPFMAPERAEGRDSGAAADVYGLGATLYAFVTGRAPYEGEEFLEILSRVRSQDPPPPSSLTPGLAADLERVILKAMARDPADRYPTAAALAADLERLEQGRPVDVRVPRRPRSRRPWVAAGLLVALIAVGAALLPRRSDPAAAMRLLESARHEVDRVQEALYAPRPIDVAGRLDRGRDLIRQALAASPRLALARHRWGELEELDGRFDRAREAWEEALAADPGLAAAQYRLGRVLLFEAYLVGLNLWNAPEAVIREEAGGLARRAVERLEAARAEGFENDLQRALSEAMVAYSAGQAARAAELCRAGFAAHEGRRGSEEFLWLEGLTAQGSEGRALFDRAIALRPHFALARFSRGTALMREARHAEAVGDFDAALKASPRFAEAILHRANALAFSGNLDGATKDFERLLDDPRLSAAAYNGRAWIRRRSGDPEGALSDLGEAIRRRPATNYLAYVYRAELRLERKDWAGAADDAKASYAIHAWGWSLSLLLQARAGTRDWITAQADLDALGVPADDEIRRTLSSLRGP
jgi:tetratricopeptide (TPR) repeat protein